MYLKRERQKRKNFKNPNELQDSNESDEQIQNWED